MVFIFQKKIFIDKEIDAAAKASERFYRGDFDHPSARLRDMGGWSPKDGYNVLRNNNYVGEIMQHMGKLVRKPLLSSCASLLLGKSVRYWSDQLIHKPSSNKGKAVKIGWHTDRRYWPSCSSDDMLTVWIPFQDITEDMGPVCYLKGSNKWPDNTHLDFHDNNLTAQEELIKNNGTPFTKVPALIKKGHVSFHYSKTVHGSYSNQSGRPRRVMTVHFQSDNNRYRKVYDKDGNIALRGNDHWVRKRNGLPDYTDPEYFPLLAEY